MRLIWLMVAVIAMAGVAANAAPSPWEQPASDLANQIAAILGPGQAHLTIRNLSTIPNDEIPTIRRLLMQDLKAHGVVIAGVESANTIRVTLSESTRKRIFVAEVGEGNQSQVAIVEVGAIGTQPAPIADGLLLRSQQIFTANMPMLAALEDNGRLVTAEPEALHLYGKSENRWAEQAQLDFVHKNGVSRDPRAILILERAADGNSFEMFTDAVRCTGNFAATEQSGWAATCSASDDPWPIAGDNSGAQQLKAFYNSARNYFTGVVSPSVGVDLPPFYSAALIPRAAGSAALLVSGIDGKVQLVENSALKQVAGTRDWGSDFAVLESGCGAGVQLIASSSGEAAIDSLRAYELAALEAVPASAPLAMNGTVTALSPAPDGKSVLAVVRNTASEYEVDRVTVLCN